MVIKYCSKHIDQSFTCCNYKNIYVITINKHVYLCNYKQITIIFMYLYNKYCIEVRLLSYSLLPSMYQCDSFIMQICIIHGFILHNYPTDFIISARKLTIHFYSQIIFTLTVISKTLRSNIT